jgi:hypothetical protein
MMTKFLFPLFLLSSVVCESNAQSKEIEPAPIQKHSFGLHGGLTLLENPLVFYPHLHLSYSKTMMGANRHRLAVLYQLGGIFLPNIENKFLFSVSAQYKYVGKKRLEANVFLGLNNQLRRHAYDRYDYEGTELVNKGRYRYQLGPTAGINLGYKIVKRANYSVTPFVGLSLTKLNKDYQSKLFTGYKPSLAIGFTINK